MGKRDNDINFNINLISNEVSQSKIGEEINCTIKLIRNDCEILKLFASGCKNDIYLLCLIPYFALFCRSIQEYFEVELINEEVDAEIYDMRNSIKIFGKRYGRSRRDFLDLDEKHSVEFKNELRYNFMKRWNIHYNLGIYFDMNDNPIGNTQLIDNSLHLSGLSKEKKEEKSYALGYHLASVISRVSNQLTYFGKESGICYNEKDQRVFYADINTNNTKFFSCEFSKDINLFMLHTLCNINFPKYILVTLLEKNNLWLFRVEYISIHYAYIGMQKLKGHLQNQKPKMTNFINELESVILNGKHLFESDFRNCMMHYDLSKKGNFMISEEDFDEEKNFFGLVETCFAGKSFAEISQELLSYGEQIEVLITKHLNFEALTIKELT